VVKLWFDLAMGLISYRIASPIQWDSPQHEIDDRGPGRPRLHRSAAFAQDKTPEEVAAAAATPFCSSGRCSTTCGTGAPSTSW